MSTLSTAESQSAHQHQSSLMAGAFEVDSDFRGEFSTSDTSDAHEHESQSQHRQASYGEHSFLSDGEDSSSLLPPQLHEPSSLMEDSRKRAQIHNHSLNTTGLGMETKQEEESQIPEMAMNNTVVEEQEMHKRLGDIESSFLPEPSAMTTLSAGDSEATYEHPSRISESDSNLRDASKESSYTGDIKEQFVTQYRSEQHAQEPDALQSPLTPPASYKTPMPEMQIQRTLAMADREPPKTPEMSNTSALEQMSSSPTAARTVSRVQSLATMSGYETAAEPEEPDTPSRPTHNLSDPDVTPRRGNVVSNTHTSEQTSNTETGSDAPIPNASRKRPNYLNKRTSKARLSYDSMESSTTETSDQTVGADFAIQSGGAAPEASRLKRKGGHLSLSRSASLGSIGSFGSDDDDGFSKRPAAVVAPELSTLQEESPTHAKYNIVTPRASTHSFQMPTESVIANHVRDLEVPGTVARQFRSERNRSPDKSLSMAMMTPGAKRGLTLKEHRSTVEKLGKENFDLKMKIHFLDQALQKRSEDGIKEMITENVQLKSDRMRLEKDNHSLRKQVRDLQKKLEEATGGKDAEDPGYATDEERSPTIEEEVLYLRERIETTEIELEKLRQDNFAKETEKRRLAEMVRNLGDSRAGASEVGSREERDMWKDMLEAETIAREQAEDDAKKLREEVVRVRQESLASNGKSKLRVIGGQIVSRSDSVDGQKAVADSAELERLRHEVSELQKTIGAQASALTSRNKEKEMLYHEIENMKLGRMSGLRSYAGDSILDRSASRARSNSRASHATRYTNLSENERENLEVRIDHLRDELSLHKLEKQNLQTQFDEALAELDAIDAQAQADADQFNEELMLLTQERDNALRDAEEQDQAFQQLKNEAQEEIDGLGDELDAKIDECARLEEDLKLQAENVKMLQAEMRSASEGLLRIEEDAQQNLSHYQSVKAQLDEANRELESMEKNLTESQNKIERLTVQQESSHNEIAFLREEQDGDKIKIGDLESLLKKTHLNLEAERDRARDFEKRLGEERQSREAVVDQGKQHVQHIINDLNREVSTHKEELRRTKQTLTTREVEVTGFKDRLHQLEDSLRQIINDPTASSSHVIGTLSKLQGDLDQANLELDTTRSRLDEHVKLLSERDTLLESTALESRSLTEQLEREKQARRQDKHSFEQSLKSHAQAARVVSVSNARIAELEQARQGHRKQLSVVEGNYKDQLAERNQVLLTIWKKLSAMCGPDWAHNHSLINGNLPSQEVIGNMLFWPGFSRNLMLATKQVEGVLTGFKDRVKRIERDLHREYNNLEKEFDLRNRKLERIEEAWEKIKLREREIEAGFAHSHHYKAIVAARAPEMQKLKGENKLLRAELHLLQQQHSRGGHGSYSHRGSGQRSESRTSSHASFDAQSVTNGGIPVRRSSMRGKASAPLSRHQSANAVETMSGFDGKSSRSNSITSPVKGGEIGFPVGNNTTPAYTKDDIRRSLIVPNQPFNAPPNGVFGLPGASHPNSSTNGIISPPSVTASDLATGSSKQNGESDGKWIHRLRELERRLKTEREQRLVDRSGMRKRLEERDAVNEELRRELEKERASRGWKADHDGDQDGEDMIEGAEEDVFIKRKLASHSPGIGKDHSSRAKERERFRILG